VTSERTKAFACDADREDVRALPGRPSDPEGESHIQSRSLTGV
jgi:hypothetical protein